MRVSTDRGKALLWAFEARVSGRSDEHGYAVASVAGNCSSPIPVEMAGAPDPSRVKLGIESEKVLYADLHVRCRKCPECLRARAALWRIRAKNEIEAWPRTWFITLTLSPENHFRVAAAIDMQLSAGGDRLGDLSPDEQFARRCGIIGMELTRYFKRIRKASGAPLRYCLVAERHKSGLPHYHMLLHECSIDFPIRHRVIVEKWRLGFIQAKLADLGSAGYVAKYLAKASAARVRASEQYGNALGHRERSERENSDTPQTTRAPAAGAAPVADALHHEGVKRHGSRF